MLCKQCGSTQFEEENGLFYCCFCQTQCQGFTQETTTDIDISQIQKKVKEKRIKRIMKEKTGVLWTTTEAFNIILNKQMKQIFEITSEKTDFKKINELTKLIWFSYLRKSGLTWTKGEKAGTKLVTRRLHPASRFRDIQILTNRVDKHLPPFKNGSTELGFRNLYTIGSDGLIRTFKESEDLTDFENKLTEEEKSYQSLDLFSPRYRDPRKYFKNKSRRLSIPNESRKQLKQILDKMIINEDFDNFDDNQNVINIEGNDFIDEEDIRDSPKSKTSLDSMDSFVNDYDKQLMRNLTETTELYSKYIPLSYLKRSMNINSNYFIDLMSLPKTLAILNIVFRLLSYNIYVFDLIRWAFEGHISYNNCFTVFPEDWLLIPNDFRTFSSRCVASHRTINILSVKIANHISIKSFPRPNLKKLMMRFAKDLNLPKDIVYIIDSEYNLIEHFPKKLDKLSNKCRTETIMPSYEMWALMAIVLILKRIFGLNDSTERRLSRSVQNEEICFIWNDWEEYSRHRLHLIRSYFIPSYTTDLDDIRDIDLIADHFYKNSENQPVLGDNKNVSFRDLDFRDEIQEEFKEFLFEEPEPHKSEPLQPSLYPLTNATNFALNRINCLDSIQSTLWNEKLSISFEDKSMRQWMCHDGKTFHRGYHFLDSDHNKWSDSFKLLIYLSCFMVSCRVDALIPVLKEMERVYFSNKF